MKEIKIVITVITFMIFLIIVLSKLNLEEDFTDEMKRERADQAYKTLKHNKDMPSYPKFKEILPGGIDAVEYTDLSKLKNKGRFTIDNIENIFGLYKN